MSTAAHHAAIRAKKTAAGSRALKTRTMKRHPGAAAGAADPPASRPETTSPLMASLAPVAPLYPAAPASQRLSSRVSTRQVTDYIFHRKDPLRERDGDAFVTPDRAMVERGSQNVDHGEIAFETAWRRKAQLSRCRGVCNAFRTHLRRSLWLSP